MVRSNIFSTLVVTCGPLKFRLLSCGPNRGHPFRGVPRARHRIFPVTGQRRIDLLVVGPLTNKLLMPKRTFPPERHFSARAAALGTNSVLQFVLRRPKIYDIMPNATSIMRTRRGTLTNCSRPALGLTPSSVGSSVGTVRASLYDHYNCYSDLYDRSLPVS